MESELRYLLYSAVDAFAAPLGLPVAHPGTDFDPASLPKRTSSYLRTATLPSEPEELLVDGDEARFLWTAQVSVYARPGVGELPALEIAQAIREAFPRSTRFVGDAVTFSVRSVAAIRPSVTTAGWFFFPVQFRVQAIT